MKKILLALLCLPSIAFAAQQEITAVPDSPVLPSIGALKDAINPKLLDIDENFDELYPAVSGKETALGNPASDGYVLSSTAAGVRSWIEMTGGAGDDLGSAAYTDVVALWTTCTGYLKSDGTCDTPSGSATYPSAAGVANWNGSAWGTSYTVGTGNNNLVQLNSAAQLPAVSGALLTGSFTGTLIGSQTTLSGAIQTIGTEWDGQYELLFDSDDFIETAGAGTVTVSIKKKEYIGWSVVNSDTATAVADGKMGAAVPAGMNEMNLTDVTCSVAALNAAASGATTAVIRRVRLGSRMGDNTSQFDLTFSTPNVTVTWDSTGTDPGISTSTLAAGDEVDISGFETAANNGHFTVATVGANYFTFANASGVENLDDTGVTITPIRHRDMTSTGVTIEYGDYTASDEVIDTSNDDLATGDKLYVDINAVTTAAQKGLHCTATFEAP